MDLVTGAKTWDCDDVRTLKILHRAKRFSAAVDNRGCLYMQQEIRKPVTSDFFFVCVCLLIDFAAQLGCSVLDD